MKLTNLLMAFIFLFGMASCSKDDKCSQDDWVGTYEYVSSNGECDGVSQEDIVITKNGDVLAINGETATASECTIAQSSEIFGIKVEATMTLNGDDLDFVVKATDEDGTTGTCTSKFKKK